jgi:alanine racemase
VARAHRRPVRAEVERDALVDNARRMASLVSPSMLCAVVKADAYGHGAVVAARAFLEGGATWLAVALVEEGIELRRSGIAAPILLLSEPPEGGMDEAVVHDLTPTIYTRTGLEALVASAKRLGDGRNPVGVHLKVDTGMHRVGADAKDALELVESIVTEPSVTLKGIWTHLAVADQPGDPYTVGQLELFDSVLDPVLGSTSHGEESLLIHAANSAASVAFPDARRSMVRCGLALYGYLPGELSGKVPLRPALALKAQVSFVKTLSAGERLSYGLEYETTADSVIATVPLGYADGVPRRFGPAGGQVLVGGRRRPVAGNVTMDQLMVDCGPNAAVEVGDEVVLIGRQGEDAITAEDWSRWLGVIVYEVLCGIGPRVPRVTV